MSTPGRLHFKIYQGSTFNEVLRWETLFKTYVPITAISKSAPLVVTAPTHGVPKEWRVKFTNILGMVELNSIETYHQVTDVTTNSLTINTVNSLAYKDYISGGVLEYNTPVNLTGYTARMQIRNKVDSTTSIIELTTENSGIVLDNINKTILLQMSALTTSAFNFINAVYSLELVSSGGQVTTLVSGNITLVKEVTR
jgi:hypothetical protein